MNPYDLYIENPFFALKYAQGPLENFQGKNQTIDIYQIPEILIGYIGFTRAWKNQSIKELVYSLGGIYQEEKNSSGRTKKDSSFIFTESFNNNQRTIHKIKLKSHEGDNIKSNNGPNAQENIIVIPYLKSRGFKSHINQITDILNYENIDTTKCVGLITRIENKTSITPLRKTLLDKSIRLKDTYFVNNKNKKDYSLNTINEANIYALMSLLRELNPNMKLISFSDEKIPNSLDGLIVKHNNHLEIKETTEQHIKGFEEFWYNPFFNKENNFKKHLLNSVNF